MTAFNAVHAAKYNIAFSNSFVGGLQGVFTSFQSSVKAFDANCNSGVIYTSSSPEIFLYKFADNKLFGYTFPPGSIDLSQLRILGISSDGTFLWRNETILPDGNPIRAVKNGVLYVFGQDTTDSNNRKLFLVNSNDGQILNSLETIPYCAACGVAVANEGTIYLNDKTSTKIYKIN